MSYPNSGNRFTLKKVISGVLLAFALLWVGITTAEDMNAPNPHMGEIVDTNTAQLAQVSENNSYTSKDEVAAYIHEFDALPPNYVTKSEAKAAGWIPEEGNLQEVIPDACIGGDKFYNDDKILPEDKNRTYRECDVEYFGGHRGPERLVYSNDGLVFYTGDHYDTFEQLY